MLRIFSGGLTALAMVLGGSVANAQLSGAIFTTTFDGGYVNGNVVYEHKEEVYLDGGPPVNAPIDAAGLPDGLYYFQVTDPSGKVLLSEDPVVCRNFEVEDGVIVDHFPASYAASEKVRGKWVSLTNDCEHVTGVDVDHDALTVQLYPYGDTPNRGGVYKVWVTPVDKFVGDPNNIDNDGHFHGFVPRWSKTDNYKVRRKGRQLTPPVITVRKFNDVNWNGAIDSGEEELGVDRFPGWPVSATDPLGVTNNAYTPWIIAPAEPEGTWLIIEDLLDDWAQTGLIVDGASLTPSLTAQVEVFGDDEETHEVIFLNAEYGDIKVCKVFAVAGGLPVPGFKITLSGTDILGNTYGPDEKTTGADGCVIYDDLLPGEYTVSEAVPSDWFAITDTSENVTIIGGNNNNVEFVNYCKKIVEMFTKGYWQNQGLDQIDGDDLSYLNGLAPYMTGNVATTGQENGSGESCPSTTVLPFDNAGELGCYIVAPNSGANEPNIGLAQQLAAFILNMREAGELGGIIILPAPYGNMAVEDVVTAAVAAWLSGNGVSEWQSLLDALNNQHENGVEVIPSTPCGVVYD